MADVEANKECTVEWFEKKYHLRISEPVKAAGKKGKLKFGGGMSSDEVSAIASESEDNNDEEEVPMSELVDHQSAGLISATGI